MGEKDHNDPDDRRRSRQQYQPSERYENGPGGEARISATRRKQSPQVVERGTHGYKSPTYRGGTTNDIQYGKRAG